MYGYDDAIINIYIKVTWTVDGDAEKSVHCELDKKLKVGQVKCSVCGEQW